jgi:Fic family protein
MKRDITGEYVTISKAQGEICRAFVPVPLPPDPPLRIDGELREKMDHALLALGRLDSISSLLPDTQLFIYMYVRKEAVLSSQIEGTQSSLSDLLLFECKEAPGAPLDDVVEVSNYVAALSHGLERLYGGFPLSLRLIREIHKILVKRGRGSDKDAGEFRRSQNWVGGTRPGNAEYVPPPPDRVTECMGALELYLHDKFGKNPTLINAALAHGQFESIHPFLDGNGRLGRLLITFLFCAEGILKEPLLYLSLYFKKHRREYYDLLQRLRTEGDWESWLSFFLDGINETAGSAVETAKTLTTLFENNRKKIQQIGKKAGSALRIHRVLERQPVIGITRAAQKSGVTPPTATRAIQALQDLGIVREVTGQRRNKLYAYTRYIDILSEGTEPL